MTSGPFSLVRLSMPCPAQLPAWLPSPAPSLRGRAAAAGREVQAGSGTSSGPVFP